MATDRLWISPLGPPLGLIRQTLDLALMLQTKLVQELECEFSRGCGSGTDQRGGRPQCGARGRPTVGGGSGGEPPNSQMELGRCGGGVGRVFMRYFSACASLNHFIVGFV